MDGAWRLAAKIALGVLLIVLGAVPGLAEKRVALVIGNSAYRSVAGLPNPVNNSAAVVALLKAIKFDVVETRRDVGIAELRRAIGDFSDQAADSDVAVVYFAGHGIEIDGMNYLIPVDARLVRDFDVEDETVSLDRVLKALEGVKRLKLVILDACRENPFVRTMRRTVASRSVGRGLARVEPATSDTLVVFAAKAGSVALDGDGANSPFTTALLKHIATPGLDVRLALGRVRDDVLSLTGRRQEPFLYGSLGGESIALVNGPVQAIPAALPCAAAEAHWKSAEAIGTLAAFEDHLARFPNCAFAGLAQVRIDSLKTTVVAKAPDRITPPSAADPPGGLSASLPQRATLYEEDPADPLGRKSTGSVTWRTEMAAPMPGESPRLMIRADLAVPARDMTSTITLYRNSDKSLPASHVAEMKFNLPVNSPLGGVDNVPGMLMKQSEQQRGAPLAGLAVKVKSGHFLLGFSAVPSDTQHNVELLLQRDWIDIPIVYGNGRRAILAIEKGAPGNRVFSEAFAAWNRSNPRAAVPK